mmetsp:Transcript_41335/g.109501  ORF Transcript_41335/g.109501 Transcript_41335/m.109501 type:complete len:86 (+) Transcript_41335:1114-1371(+)
MTSAPQEQVRSLLGHGFFCQQLAPVPAGVSALANRHWANPKEKAATVGPQDRPASRPAGQALARVQEEAAQTWWPTARGMPVHFP